MQTILLLKKGSDFTHSQNKEGKGKGKGKEIKLGKFSTAVASYEDSSER